MAVRKGKAALPTQVHASKRRYRRTDVIDDVTYGDWYEQDLKQMGADQSKHQYNPTLEKSK